MPKPAKKGALRHKVACVTGLSVTEVTFTGKDHHDAALIGGGNDFVVTDRAARLDHAGCALINDHIESVAEREEGVARGGAPRQRKAGLLRLTLRSDSLQS